MFSDVINIFDFYTPFLGGVVELTIAGAIASTVIGIGFALLASRNQNQDAQKPNSIDVFRQSQSKEALTVFHTCGRVRHAGNNLDIRNLKTKRLEAEGGKGFGSSSAATAGYRYFADLWFGICIGNVNLIKTYINDKEEDASARASETVFNDGDDTNFPDWSPGATANPGLSHIAYERFRLGDNVNTIPTINFVTEKVYDGTIANSNMSNGSNPAAFAHDILKTADESDSRIDLTSFVTAAGTWNTKGYGLNLIFGEKGNVENAINKILGYVDGMLYRNNLGQWKVRALEGTDTSVVTINKADMRKFSFSKKPWKAVPNVFNATFISEELDFSDRTISVENPAAIFISDTENPTSIDLKCFRDKETASKRLFEIAKRESYPSLQISIEVGLRYMTLEPGDIITINHPKFGIVSADFRITKINLPKVDEVNVNIEARQFVEGLHDDVFEVRFDNNTTDLDTAPIALTKIKIFEVPYNQFTQDTPAFIIFASREKGFEVSYDVLISDNSSSAFDAKGTFSTFSQNGFLTISYPDNTYQIDDTIGITFQPKNDFDEFDTISRDQLFSVQRIICINDELMYFQTVTKNLDGTITLTGIRRGAFNTPIQSHSVNDEVYLAFISSNVIENPGFTDFHVKILPRFNNNVLDASLVTPISVTTTSKAKKPRNPARIVATRTSSSNIDVQIHPNTPGVNGASDDLVTVTDTPKPYPFLGDFVVSYDSTTEIKTISSFRINFTGDVDITVKSRLNAFESSGLTVSVGSANGEYIA